MEITPLGFWIFGMSCFLLGVCVGIFAISTRRK